ncbi:hypothetical protein [Mycoplasma sp. P36-A1]|uniref:hypothetical protein n=1 Tax=Mycoplasma sp. P36-A1 TaxID=3252900 RepID=UPI003C2AB142
MKFKKIFAIVCICIIATACGQKKAEKKADTKTETKADAKATSQEVAFDSDKNKSDNIFKSSTYYDAVIKEFKKLPEEKKGYFSGEKNKIEITIGKYKDNIGLTSVDYIAPKKETAALLKEVNTLLKSQTIKELTAKDMDKIIAATGKETIINGVTFTTVASKKADTVHINVSAFKESKK